MSRFFVDQGAIKEDTVEITDREDIRHMTKVLRLKEGDFIDVSDSEEYEYRVELTQVCTDLVKGRIHDKQSFSREPEISVTLYQAVPKQGKMELIIQKTVELGVKRLIPVFTKRCVVTDKGGFEKKRLRWQRISEEAVKQCRRGMIPPIGEPETFSVMAEEICRGYDLVVFLYENEKKTTLKEVLREFSSQGRKDSASVALIVGPEGGFSEEEAEILKAGPARCASLGKTVLRTETAGMAALAMVMYELEL